MSNRKSYKNISAEKFKVELQSNVMGFLSNMEHLKVGKLSFPEWYETFGAWLEVGTSMEEVYYHTSATCSDGECKLCN